MFLFMLFCFVSISLVGLKLGYKRVKRIARRGLLGSDGLVKRLRARKRARRRCYKHILDNWSDYLHLPVVQGFLRFKMEKLGLRADDPPQVAFPQPIPSRDGN